MGMISCGLSGTTFIRRKSRNWPESLSGVMHTDKSVFSGWCHASRGRSARLELKSAVNIWQKPDISSGKQAFLGNSSRRVRGARHSNKSRERQTCDFFESRISTKRVIFLRNLHSSLIWPQIMEIGGSDQNLVMKTWKSHSYAAWEWDFAFMRRT